jgi:hypothetical protein
MGLLSSVPSLSARQHHSTVANGGFPTSVSSPTVPTIDLTIPSSRPAAWATDHPADNLGISLQRASDENDVSGAMRIGNLAGLGRTSRATDGPLVTIV